jgi:hypothetical protein
MLTEISADIRTLFTLIPGCYLGSRQLRLRPNPYLLIHLLSSNLIQRSVDKMTLLNNLNNQSVHRDSVM